MKISRIVPFALLLVTAPLAAQEVKDSVASIQVEPLVVTVLRTPIASERAPFAISALGEAEVRRGKAGVGLDEALRGVVGVQVDNRYNFALGERISVRGAGARSQFGVRGVKVLVDGIPATMPDGQTTLNHVNFSTLGRVEVVRGPASVLYGNAAGGVLSFETVPPPDHPFREVGVTAGSNGLLRLSGTAGGTMGDVGYRVDVSHLGYDGYREHNAAETLHASARIDYRALRLTAGFVDYDAQNPGALTAALLEEDRRQAFGNNVAQRTGERGRQVQLGATVRHGVAGGELEVAAFGVVREVDNPIPPTIIDLDRVAGGARAVFRTANAAGAWTLRWTAGIELEAQRDDRQNFVNQAGERGALTLDQRERVAGIGGFAHLVASPGERLDVLAGLRYDAFSFAVDDRLVDASDPDDSGSRRMGALSPSLGVRFGLGADHALYANVTTAFATPTTTELANRPTGAGGFNPDLEPERTRSVEAGARGALGGAIAYQISAYHMRIREALIPFEVESAPGRQYFRNAGTAIHRGVEASARVDLPRGFGARVAYTLTDARFDRYRIDDQVLDGNRIPGVAPHRLEAAVSWEGDDGWFVDLEGRRLTAIPTDDANTAESPAYTVVDVRAGHDGFTLGSVRIAPFAGVSNLLDAEYNTAVTVNAFGGRYFEPGPGRAVHVGLRVGR